MEVLRFDFNGSYKDFKRTAQGFLRVNARLSKTGVFDYEQRREYRPDEEVLLLYRTLARIGSINRFFSFCPSTKA
jgi:hypothetical protein